MKQVMAISAAIVFVIILLLFLAAMIRFSLVSTLTMRRERKSLRRPKPDGVEEECGFSPPPALVDRLKSIPYIENFEFSLIDRRSSPPTPWFIGSFIPLTRPAVREWRRIAKVPGIPIAKGLDGVYYVAKNGTVRIKTTNEKDVEVAPNSEVFFDFEFQED